MRALGVDIGTRRIGLALSDPTGLLARPWKAMARPAGAATLARELARLISELRRETDGLSTVVLGFPRRLNGEPTRLTAEVRELASRLEPLIDVPIVLQDERLSSREAETLLARREKDWRRRKAVLDATAAAVILQDYLDALSGSRPLTLEGDEPL